MKVVQSRHLHQLSLAGDIRSAGTLHLDHSGAEVSRPPPLRQSKKNPRRDTAPKFDIRSGIFASLIFCQEQERRLLGLNPSNDAFRRLDFLRRSRHRRRHHVSRVHRRRIHRVRHRCLLHEGALR